MSGWSVALMVLATIAVVIVMGLWWLVNYTRAEYEADERYQRQKKEQEQLARALAAAAKPAFYADLERQAQEREAYRIRQQAEAAERKAREEVERGQEIDAIVRQRAMERERAARTEAARLHNLLEQNLVAEFHRYRFENDLVPKAHHTPAERVAFLVHLTEKMTNESFDSSRAMVAFIENDPQRVWELLDQATAWAAGRLMNDKEGCS